MTQCADWKSKSTRCTNYSSKEIVTLTKYQPFSFSHYLLVYFFSLGDDSRFLVPPPRMFLAVKEITQKGFFQGDFHETL